MVFLHFTLCIPTRFSFSFSHVYVHWLPEIHYMSYSPVLPCPQGPPAAGVWQVHCACLSVHRTLGWLCSYEPGSPRRLSAVFQHHDGSFCRGTMSGLPAPPVLGRPVSAQEEGLSCPRMLPCEDQRSGTGLALGTADGTATEWHPRRALV